MAPSLTPLLHPHDDIHTHQGGEPSLGTGGKQQSPATPEAMQLMSLPGDGLPTSRFSTLLPSIFPGELELNNPSTWKVSCWIGSGTDP